MGSMGVGPVILDGAVFLANGQILDLMTGQKLGQLKAPDPRDPRGIRQLEVKDDNGQDAVFGGSDRLVLGSKNSDTLVFKVTRGENGWQCELLSSGNVTASAMLRDLFLLKIPSRQLGELVRSGHLPNARYRYANKTPSGDSLYIRTSDALWCVGEPRPKGGDTSAVEGQ